MCNLYTPVSAHRLAAQFGKVAMKEGLKQWGSYVAPLKLGPYIKQDAALEVGQWGMIATDNKTRLPRGQTNNARYEDILSRRTYAPSWLAGRRCLIPVESFIEPYYPGHDPKVKSIAWRFARADGEAWALAGIWSEWTDPETGEVVPNYTMLTQNCDGHPLLALMHKPEVDRKTGAVLPLTQQDKRAVVPIEQDKWDEWLHADIEQAGALVKLPAPEIFRHAADNLAKNIPLPGAAAEGQIAPEPSGELF